MHAIILHAPNDEQRAAGVAGSLAAGESVRTSYFSPDQVRFGDDLVLLAVWSTNAARASYGSTLQAIAEDNPMRLIVVRADETPLPELSPAVSVARIDEPEAAFSAKFKVAAARAGRATNGRTPSLRRQPASARGLSAGVGMGLAIYAGMFVAAGAWRSDELRVAADTGRAPQVVHGALRSFKTAFAQGQDFHVASSASGQFQTVYRADASSIRSVPADAGLRAVDSVRSIHAADVVPTSSVAPGLAAAGVASLGLATEFASVTVGGNDAY